MAQDAVDDYLTNVSENTLLKEQDSLDMRNLRQELLQSALKYYQQFVNQRGHDPRLRQELANAYFRLGEITQRDRFAARGDRFVRLGTRRSGNNLPPMSPRMTTSKATWPFAT